MWWHKPSKLPLGRQGFTIIEVMIVLAVTGALFISVALVISGKQQTAQFQTSMNDVRSQIRQVGNEVVSGFFPNNNNYDCTISGSPQVITLVSKPVASSSNGKCNYIGKALHFYKGDSKGIFSVYSVLGVDSGQDSYANTQPFLLAKTAAYNTNNSNDYDVTKNLKLNYGLGAATMKYYDDSNSMTRIGSFAFMQSLNKSVDSADAGSASQHLNIVAFTNPSAPVSSIDNDQISETDAIDRAFRNGTSGYSVGGRVELCFNSGTTNQNGLVTIGVGSSQLDVSSQIRNGQCAP